MGVQDKDGKWLISSHGLWFDEARMAKVCAAKEEAEKLAEVYKEYDTTIEYNIVPAWEPLCERLRAEVQALKKANSLSPATINHVQYEIDNVISSLREIKTELSK